MLAAPLSAQISEADLAKPCPELPIIIERLEDAIESGNATTALEQILALRACDTRPERQPHIDNYFEQVVDTLATLLRKAEEQQRLVEEANQDLLRTQDRLNRALVSVRITRDSSSEAARRAEEALKAVQIAQTKADSSHRSALANVYLNYLYNMEEMLERSPEEFSATQRDIAILLTDFTYRYVDSSLANMTSTILQLYHQPYLEGLDSRQAAGDSREKQVQSIRWSPNGQYAALSVTGVGMVILGYDGNARPLLFRLESTVGEPHAAAWSPDGEVLAGVYGKQLLLWQTNNWSFLRTINLPEPAFAMAWEDQGERVALGGLSGTVYLVNTSTGTTEVKLARHTDTVRDLAWSADGKQLVSAAEDNLAIVWDVAAQDTVRVLHDHTDWVRTVAWHPSGDLLFTGCDDREIRIWNTRDWELRGAIVASYWNSDQTFSPTNAVRNIAFNGNGSLISVSDIGSNMYLLDSAGSLVMNWKQTIASSVAAWRPDTDIMLVGGIGDSLFFYQTSEQGAVVQEVLRLSEQLALTDRNSLLYDTDRNQNTTAVAWSPNGDLLASYCTDGTLRLFDYSREVRTARVIPAEIRDVTALAWSPDNTQIAAASRQRVINIWQLYNDSLIFALPTPVQPLTIDWSPDGRLLAFAGRDNIIYIYDLQRRAYVRQLEGHTGTIRKVAWSPLPDGLLASASDDYTVRVWEAYPEEGRSVVVGRHEDWVRDLGWFNGNRGLASAGDDYRTIIWHFDPKTLTGGRRHELIDSSGFHLAVSVQDSTVAIGTFGQMLSVWDLNGATNSLHYSQRMEQAVTALSLHPRGNRLAANAKGGTPRVTNLMTGLPDVEAWKAERSGRQRKRRPQYENFSFTDPAETLRWRPNANHFSFIDAEKRTIPLRDLRNEHVQPLLEAPAETTLRDHLWSPSGRRVAATTHGTEIIVWEILKGLPARRTALDFPAEESAIITDWCWSLDGNYLAGRSETDWLYLWKTNSGEDNAPPVASTQLRDAYALQDMTLLPEKQGQLLLLYADSLVAWNYEQSIQGVSKSGADEFVTLKQDIQFTHIRPLGNSRFLLLAAPYDESPAPMVIDLSREEIQTPLSFENLDGGFLVYDLVEDDYLLGAPIVRKGQQDSPWDGASEQLSAVAIWQIQDGDLVGEIEATKDLELFDVAMSPDHRYIAVAGRKRTEVGQTVVQLWDWAREALLLEYQNIGEEVSFSRDGSYLVIRRRDGQVSFLPIVAEELIGELMNSLEFAELEKGMIKLFSLEEGLAIKPGNIERFLREESPSQTAAWCEYFLDGVRFTVDDQRVREAYYSAIELLGRPGSAAYRSSDQLAPLRLQAYEGLGGFWLNRKQLDSAHFYLQGAYELGGRANRNLQARLTMIEWFRANRRAGFSGITQMLESQHQAALYEEFEKMLPRWFDLDSIAPSPASEVADARTLGRIIYLDQLPPRLERLLLGGRESTDLAPIEQVVAPYPIDWRERYLLLYYYHNRDNKKVMASERRRYMERALAILADRDPLDDQDILRYYTFAHPLALSFYESGEPDRALALADQNQQRLQTLIDRGASDPTRTNYRRKWMARTVAQKAWFLMREGRIQEAGSAMRPLWERDSVFAHIDLILQQAHFQVLSGNLSQGLRLYRHAIEQAAPEDDIRSRINREMRYLDDEKLAEVAAGTRRMEAFNTWEAERRELSLKRDQAYADGENQAAVTYSERIVTLDEAVLPDVETLHQKAVITGEELSDVRRRMAVDYGNHSFYVLFNQQFVSAEQAALRSAELHDLDWVKTNLAHSYLFQDRWEEARDLYESLGGLPDDSSNEASNLGVLLLQDFTVLKEAGIWHENVPRAAALLLGVQKLKPEDALKYGPPQ